MKKDRVRPNDIVRILESQQYRCAYTGDELTPDNVSADHLVPVAMGGAHGIENIRLVIRDVNRMKGTMSLDEFVALCRKVVDYFDRNGGETGDLSAVAGGEETMVVSSLFDGGDNGEE